jgi:hypothetical protein
MGKRREPRKTVEVPVRIFGTDVHGKIFSENVTALDVSQGGARLGGVRAQLKVDEIIGLTYGKSKVHFRMKWAGAAGSHSEGQVGLLNLNPEKPLWDFPLPHGIVADTFRSAVDRRHSPRVKCSISVELHRDGQPVIWGKASDLSVGGCFVEMPIPLPVEPISPSRSGWAKPLRVQGQVASTSPGFGIGVRFSNVSPKTQDFLQRHMEGMAS